MILLPFRCFAVFRNSAIGVLSLLLLVVQSAMAGELVVTVAREIDRDGLGVGSPMVLSFKSGNLLRADKHEVGQEGQVEIYIYRNVESGRYRISLQEMGHPLGFSESLMETHVNVEDDSIVPAFLYEPKPVKFRRLDLPDEVWDALNKHTKNKACFMDLSASYEGSKKKFFQVRTTGSKKGGLASGIHYLRRDGKYTIEIYELSEELESPNRILFKKTFQIKTR